MIKKNKIKNYSQKSAKVGILPALVLFFILIILSKNISLKQQVVVFAASNDNTVSLTDEEKQKLEEERIKKEKEAKKKAEKLKKLKKVVKKKEEVKAKYVQEANVIRGHINRLVSNISSVAGKLERTQQEIEELNKEIEKREKKIQTERKHLAKIIREINRQKRELQLTILDNSKGLKEYIQINDSMNKLQKQIIEKLQRLKKQKEEIEDKKKEKAEAEEVLQSQKQTLEKEKLKKSWVLGGANKKISEQEAEIREIQREMAALQSSISSLLGKSFNTDDIKKAASFASKKTGVRKAFILGMLTVESNLGRYTGGCNYKTSRMSEYRKKIFKQIAKETGHNYKKMKVSCPPARYKGTGGAMGVAQFMSDTWMGYKAKIAAATGHAHPDPWNLTDGVMAMALKLANDGATKKSGECRAAMRYLGGSHKWYCEKVLNYAKRY